MQDAHFPASRASQNDQARPQQTQSSGFWNRRAASASAASASAAATTSDCVIVQRHCPGLRQGAPAPDGCAGVQGDAGQRENISLERGRCTESRGAAHLPKHVRVRHTIAKNDGGVARGGERTTYLENELGVGIA